MRGKTVLVTGANSGIGFETAAGLAELGAHVILGVRDPWKGETAAEAIRARIDDASIEVVVGDMAHLASVRSFAERLVATHDRLDVLVNNAGLVTDRRSVTDDGFETQFQVNHLGPFLLTNLLLDLLRASAPSRIVNVSSIAHTQGVLDFDDLQSERAYAGMRVYGTTKLCNVLFTRELARRLEGTGVTANALHPGVVRTNWSGGGDVKGVLALGFRLARFAFLSPAKGARTSIYLASSPEVERETGGYYVRCRKINPSTSAQDDDTARRLWDVSAELVGLSREENR